MWHEPDFSLRHLYHPSGILPGEAHLADTLCPCGVHHAELSGFAPRGAEGRAIAAERAKERQPRSEIAARPWQGAVISSGTVRLPDQTDHCAVVRCPQEHGTYMRKRRWLSPVEQRVHLKDYPARIYTMPNGAAARVRVGAKVPGLT